MSERDIGIVILSDLHFGSIRWDHDDDNGKNGISLKESLSALFCHLERRKKSETEPLDHVVLLGDVVDLWGIDIESSPPSRESVMNLMERKEVIIFVDGVRRLCALGVNFWYQPGNHDELVGLPFLDGKSIFDLLLEKISAGEASAGNVALVDPVWERWGVLFEHGHLGELLNMPRVASSVEKDRHEPIGRWLTSILERGGMDAYGRLDAFAVNLLGKFKVENDSEVIEFFDEMVSFFMKSVTGDADVELWNVPLGPSLAMKDVISMEKEFFKKTPNLRMLLLMFFRLELYAHSRLSQVQRLSERKCSAVAIGHSHDHRKIHEMDIGWYLQTGSWVDTRGCPGYVDVAAQRTPLRFRVVSGTPGERNVDFVVTQEVIVK